MSSACSPDCPRTPRARDSLGRSNPLSWRTFTSRAPRRWSRSDSLRASASWIRSPARHSTTIRPRSRQPWRPSPAVRMTATISSTVGGSAGVAVSLVAWRAAGVESRHRRRRSPTAGGVEQQLGHDPSSGSETSREHRGRVTGRGHRARRPTRVPLRERCARLRGTERAVGSASKQQSATGGSSLPGLVRSGSVSV